MVQAVCTIYVYYMNFTSWHTWSSPLLLYTLYVYAHSSLYISSVHSPWLWLQVLGSVNMTEAINEKENPNKESYVVNPPLIHSVALSSDGLIAAAGLENGKVSPS